MIPLQREVRLLPVRRAVKELMCFESWILQCQTGFVQYLMQ